MWLLRFAQTFDMTAGRVAFAVVSQLMEGWFAPVPSDTVDSVHVMLMTGSPVRACDNSITLRISEPVQVKKLLITTVCLFDPL